MIRRICFFSLILLLNQPLHTQSKSSYNAAELRLALRKLNVLGSVLYIAAHPDDENTALLATFTKGQLYRTAYLSMTRGEGGQNLLGPEQGDLLGLIRTQELLAARRIDGAEQYFTRAIDFGYSKTTDETLRFWGKEKTLSDVVWVVRAFRPDVIITRFTPALGGHGNHTASAVLAEEAFRAAADPTRFPEQLRYMSPWQAKRIVWNVFFRQPQVDSTKKSPPIVSINLGAYSPLLGKSFTEIAGESRSMHKSQGFGAAQYRGEFMNYFQYLDGDTASKNLFDGINTGWSRIKNADSVEILLDDAYQNFDDNNPAKSIPVLFKALNRINALSRELWVIQKKKELENIILACAGIWVDATTAQTSAIPGGELNLTTTVINRSQYPFVIEREYLPFNGKDTVYNTKLEMNHIIRSNFTIHLPDTISYTQPYWLKEKPDVGSYNVTDQRLIGLADNSSPVNISVLLASPDGKIEVTTPLQQRIVDPVLGEELNPFGIVPPVAVKVDESIAVFPDQSERKVRITVKSSSVNTKGIVRLHLPEFWSVAPVQSEFNFKNIGDEQTFSFTVHPLKGAKSGKFIVEAKVENSVFSRGIRTIKYDHISPETLFPIAEGSLLKINLKHKGSTVGYIMGAGDEMPAAIRQMGYSLTLLTDEELAEENLGNYDILVAGVRAYNTRPALRTYQQRLMDYVKQGGTYIVQYVTLQRPESENIGPYPFNVSRDRVTEEEAPVTILDRNNPIISTPNKISEEDFKGWIQERGLYFADRWDARYDSVLSCHDANESGKAGGLLMAKCGKGYYVYCAYAFFRQLPAGVEGAYRLFANILSLGKTSARVK